MSSFKFKFDLIETQIDENGDFINDYETNLPHHKQIAEEICKSWNNMQMQQYYDGILSNNIISCDMRCNIDRTTKQTIVCIDFKFKPGIRLTEKYKTALIDQTNAQLSDGWGESFFGMINIMKDDKNNRFYVE